MNNLFLELFGKVKEFKYISEHYKNNLISITGLTDTVKPHFLCGLFNSTNKNILLVAKNEIYLKKLNEMLLFFNVPTHIFYERELNFFDIDAKSREINFSRLDTLINLISGKKGVYLTTPDALSQKIIPEKNLKDFSLSLKLNEDYNLDELTKKLILMGYIKNEPVESKGQFSIRGGVLDVFSPFFELPFRIEFFGDTIDSIRSFDEKTQLSVEKVESVTIYPANEVIFDDQKKEEVINKIKKIIKKNISDKLKEELKSDIEKFVNKRYFHSIDKYIGLIYENSSFYDYFKEDVITVIDEPQRIFEKCEAICNNRREQIISLTEKELIYPDFQIYQDVNSSLDRITKKDTIGMMNVLTSNPLFHPKEVFNITVTDSPTYYGKIKLLCDDLRIYKKEGYTVVIPVSDRKINNLRVYLDDSAIEADIIDETKGIPEKGIHLLRKNSGVGFCYPDMKFILINDPSVLGEHKKSSRKLKSDKDILSFNDLTIGDYVVHTTHGIGQYLGTIKLEFENIKRDFLKIKYSGTDILYVPINQLENLSKYVGAGEHKVKLHKLGGQEFARVKKRVSESCDELADKLISLYAEREKVKGHKYMPDTDMQYMFEDTFPYEETEDQLRSIKEVKSDMESEKPMDRLLCGDVGYGKTEVAMRAAFKCAAEGMQTVYLASTTVLAEQHYNSFKERMEDFPVTVEMLSRFRSKKQIEDILKRLKSGAIDIIIGTHRLLSKDVEFKNLGLLIVDEEQRFGVAHKEKLKELKNNIDVLTLTATPIPRTLHMSMLGIRDMSVLKEPPLDRFPVQTYVTEYNEEIIENAITKELSRNGQIFYLYNNTEDIFKVAKKLEDMFPDANIGVVHGKMAETKIEKTFIDMINGNIDILVCTTIIETGIDIANANTIIVENSDHLGLSQLYQLRGRVGRGNRLSYCYLTYRKDKVLTEQSEGRLKTIKEFTEFGSGFKIALRDLEIRGAGNILGSRQHGHMDAVGYDMYMKILSDTIKRHKGEKIIEVTECKVDIKENAYIPEGYIENHDMRMDMYKKIASIKTHSDVSDILDELIDRFSDPPKSVINLTDISYIKALAENAGITEISDLKSRINFSFLNPSYLNFDKISKVSEEFKNKILVNTSSVCGFSYRMNKDDLKNKIENIKNILQILQ